MNKFLAVAVSAVLTFAVVGCNNDKGVENINNSGNQETPPVDDIYRHKAPAGNLLENSWKTIGSIDVKTDSLTEFEPKERCEQCYILTFDTDTTFSSYSSVNVGSGSYSYDEHKFNIGGWSGTEINEQGDGRLWVQILWDIDSFTLLEDELRLYYNEKQNYLLLKQR